ncbi:unnamed protein product [Staurois parvus]|uniref:Uncharacterized protein n=1 Tax=Staurois parvus TaxID=386267 RepID=A0ABN9CQI3_9NEOB|nr:unnamed protein product [Staurois parvus]
MFSYVSMYTSLFTVVYRQLSLQLFFVTHQTCIQEYIFSAFQTPNACKCV